MELGRSEEWCHIIYYCLIAVKVRFIWMFVSSLMCILYFSISIVRFDCISTARSLPKCCYLPCCSLGVHSHIPQFISAFIILSNKLTQQHSTLFYRIILNVVKNNRDHLIVNVPYGALLGLRRFLKKGGV